jgi:tetratricopeptide (TPR) repeat protein
LLKQAVSLHQAGNLAQAERAYRQVLAADPRNFPARYQLALLLYQQQRRMEALRAVDAALALNPAAREALVLRSILLVDAGQLEEALACASTMTARNAGDAEGWHTRGVILARLQRPEEALVSFDRALAAKPSFVAALCHRGNTLMDLKRYPDAVAAFETTLAHAPALFDAWSNRGLALYELERFAESLENYDRAIALRPDMTSAWTNRGKTLDRLERFDEALASYDEALSRSPSDLETLYARALTLRTMHRLEDSLACVDKALAVHAEHAPLLFLRGWLLCELNNISEGLAVIRRTAAASPTGGSVTSAHHQRHDAEQRAYLAEHGEQREDGAKLNGPAVDAANRAAAAAQWDKSRPRIVVVDNFLTAPALEKLRRFCWSSPSWQKSYEDGYLGATPERGFACPLLAQIAEELHDMFPEIIGDHRLRMLWGFKYDGRLRGIGLHADQAAVNVNFWITPDEANLNPDKGGMVVWDVAAPPEWDVRTYNGNPAAVRAFLRESGAKPVTIPYRTNRAVIFESDLFHETDTIDFKEGYLNRRINLTMLYGRRTHFGR